MLLKPYPSLDRPVSSYRATPPIRDSVVWDLEAVFRFSQISSFGGYPAVNVEP